MKTNKVHRNLTGALTVISPSGSERITPQSEHNSNQENDLGDISSAEALSFRNFENFKMALFFNKIQSQLGKSK